MVNLLIIDVKGRKNNKLNDALHLMLIMGDIFIKRAVLCSLLLKLIITDVFQSIFNDGIIIFDFIENLYPKRIWCSAPTSL